MTEEEFFTASNGIQIDHLGRAVNFPAGLGEDDPQPKTNFVFLDFSTMSEDEILGHLLDTQGLIPHDAKRFSEIENEGCRIYMRTAEAFAFGYQMGKKHESEDKK